MGCSYTAKTLRLENQVFADSGGISQNNRTQGFLPGFYDAESGQMVVSRFADGRPAPIHLLDGVPGDWVTGRDVTGRVRSIKGSVISGFIRDGRFFTREDVAALTDRADAGA